MSVGLDPTAGERSATAGEYVLGTLADGERAAFEQALGSAPALQAEVYAWQDRLLGLSGRVPAVAPRQQLWSRIEAGMRRDGAAAANDPLWRRLRRWQIGSGLAAAAVLVLSALLLLRAPPTVATDRYLALLQAPDRSTGWVVEAEPGGTVHLVPIVEAVTVPPGKALQFWTKPEGAAGPTSLGLVHPGESVALAASRLPALGARQLFELTLEPEGGSPIGRPTGPVLYVGRTVRI